MASVQIEEHDEKALESPRPAVYRFVQEALDALLLKKHSKKEEHVSNADFEEQCNKINSCKFLSLLEHNYEEQAARLAYILIHFTQNTYLMNSVLSDAYSSCTNLQSRTTVFNELMKSIDWGRISVFSFGGGPAADVMGVLMWLHRFGFNVRVQAATADSCKQWEDTTKALLNMMQFESTDDDSKPTQQQKYMHNLWKKLDGGIKYVNSGLKSSTSLLKPGSKELVAIGQADIVTLPFALSPLCPKPPTPVSAEIQNALLGVLTHLKPGALLVYLDHVEGAQTELINNITYYCGMKRIYFMKDMKYSMPKYESLDLLDTYTKSLDKQVPQDAKVTAIVYKKPSGYSYDRRLKMSRREQSNVKQAQMRLKKSNPDFKLFRPSYF